MTWYNLLGMCSSSDFCTFLGSIYSPYQQTTERPYMFTNTWFSGWEIGECYWWQGFESGGCSNSLQPLKQFVWNSRLQTLTHSFSDLLNPLCFVVSLDTCQLWQSFKSCYDHLTVITLWLSDSDFSVLDNLEFFGEWSWLHVLAWCHCVGRDYSDFIV